MKDHYVPSAPSCPGCGVIVDGALGVNGDAAPNPGSISICAYCAEVGVYTDDLAIRSATVDELHDLVLDLDFLRARAAVLAVIQANQQPGDHQT